ncbi:MAG TPA: Trm112 family protein [Planctomycetaceae bacterium]|nr:Trm112 family protein [Planctomycetaceae bacterium]HIQ20537.1 Trm112 family protein [Planctomycetota bacterium]
MIDPKLLEILVCPENRTPLREASQELVEKVNQAIAAGKARNRTGQTLEKPIDGGLVREDGKVLYPVMDDIPVLLIDEGIPLDELGLAEAGREPCDG